MDFTRSIARAVGMEIEFQLLENDGLDLSYRAQPILERYGDDEHIKPEYQCNTIEVTSGVCASIGELQGDILSRIEPLIKTCAEFDTRLCGAGTHPFSRALAIITPLPRYLDFKQKEGYLSRVQITFATHVHLGMPDGDTAIRVMGELKAYLPIFIALSASSPFWRGHDTGFASYRHRILAATRSYGIPPSFSSWDEFCAFFDTMSHAGAYAAVNDIHWDIRPQPRLGTLEVRVMDAQSTVASAAALACLIRSVALYLEDTAPSDRSVSMPIPLHWWLEKENHYQASHNGISANFIKDQDGNVVKLADLFGDIIAEILPIAKAAGEVHHLERLQGMVDNGLDYARQRRQFEAGGSFQDVLGALTEELEIEVAAANNPLR